jgi:hypothetical protein
MGASSMNQSNYVHIDKDSHYFTSIEQIKNYAIYTMSGKKDLLNDFINVLKNTENEGYELTKKEKI